MKYAITENGRALVLDSLTAKELSSHANIGAKTRPLVTWPRVEESELFIKIGKQTVMLDQGIGLLLGLYIGDGWCDKNVKHPKIHIASVDQNIIDKYRELVNIYLRDTNAQGYATGNKAHDYYPEYDSVHGKFSINISPEIRDSLIDLLGHGAYNKHIPYELLNSPEPFRWGLLSGLIDTDGSISYRSMIKKGKMQQNKAAMYATQSWQLAKDVQLLCFSLGINASMSIGYRKDRHEFTLILGTMDLYSRRHNLCCVSGKAKKLDEYTFGDYPNPKDVLPFDDELHKMLLEHNGYEKGGVTYGRARREGFIVRDTFLKYASPQAIELMAGKYNIDIRWERILNIAYLPDDHTDDDLIKKIKEVKSEIKKVA